MSNDDFEGLKKLGSRVLIATAGDTKIALEVHDELVTDFHQRYIGQIILLFKELLNAAIASVVFLDRRRGTADTLHCVALVHELLEELDKRFCTCRDAEKGIAHFLSCDERVITLNLVIVLTDGSADVFESAV